MEGILWSPEHGQHGVGELMEEEQTAALRDTDSRDLEGERRSENVAKANKTDVTPPPYTV